MSGFKYELENVLNLRENEENIKQKEYAKSLEVLKEEKQKQTQIKESLKNSRHIFKHTISDHIDPKRIKAQQNYHTLLEKQHKLAISKVEKAKHKSEKQRIELLNAMKNKKTLEILKQKRLEVYLDEEKKAEQQVVDEIVSFGHTKK